MYSIEYHSSIRKDLKRLDKPAVLFLKQEVLPVIANNPYNGQLLHGEFRHYRKYVFSFNRVSYRIAYEIMQNDTVVLLILVGTRENFYKELKRRVKFFSPRAALLLLIIFTASLLFTLAPGVARGQDFSRYFICSLHCSIW